MKYRARPIEKYALEFIPDAFHAMAPPEFFEAVFKRENPQLSQVTYYIKTLEGEHIVTPGDFIIKGVRGEFYPCKPDIFAETYEKVTEL